MRESGKYALRVGGFAAVLFAVMLLVAGTLDYKARLVLMGAGLSEVLWLIFYKPAYGRTEERKGVEFLAVLLLRAALLLACVLGLTLGL